MTTGPADSEPRSEVSVVADRLPEVVSEDRSRPDVRVIVERWWARRPKPVDAATVLLAPIVMFWLLGVEPFFRQNGLDPFIYQGYAYRPDDLTARFGYSYYSVRFGVLWPMEATTALFGSTGGYFLMRWVLAVAAGGMLYAFFLRRGRWLALTMLVLFLASPVLLRGLMTTYADTTGVSYLVIGLGGLLWDPRRHRRVANAGVGLFLGLAIHSNPILAPIVVLAVLAWSAVHWRRFRPESLRRTILDLAAMGGTVVALTVLAMVVYQVRYGDWNIFKPSIDAARLYSGKEGDVWRAKNSLWASYHLQLYVPLVTVLVWGASLVGRARRIGRAELSAMTMLIAVYGYFMFNQFVQRGTILETYYYSSYLLPFTMFAIGFAIASVAEHVTTDRRALAAVPLAALGIPLFRNVVWSGFSMRWLPWIPLMALALAAGAAAAHRRQRVATVTIASLLVVTYAWWLGSPVEYRGTVVDPHFETAIGHPDWSGMDLYRLTYQLDQVTPRLLQADGSTTLFWFDSTDPVTGGIHGAFLGPATSLHSTGEGMPVITPWHVARMREERVSRLVLLGLTEGQLDAGLAALLSFGVATPDVERHVLTTDSVTVHVAVAAIDLP